MSLKNNLYTISTPEEQAAGTFKTKVALNPNHPIFEGHFPAQPVLPGVCLLNMLKDIIGAIKNKPVNLKSAATIKYIKLVDPEVEPALVFQIQISEGEGALQVIAESNLADGSANFKFKGVFV